MGFINLTRDEAGITREEWVNLDAIDHFADLTDGRTFVRLRHGGSLYVSETADQIVRLIRTILGEIAPQDECGAPPPVTDLGIGTCQRNPGHEGEHGRAGIFW